MTANEARLPLGHLRWRRFDGLLVALVAMLTIVSLVAIVTRFAFRNDGIDLLINSITAVAAAGAAALAWIRVREVGERPAVFESSAFLVLLATRLVLVVVSLLGVAAGFGTSVDAPEQWPIYAWTLARAMMAGLLILAAVAALRPEMTRRLPITIVLVLPVAALLVTIWGLPAFERSLPILLEPDRLEALATGRADPRGMNLAGIVSQGSVALLFLLGAALHRRVYQRSRRHYSGYLAVALIVAAFSQLHWAVVPGPYTPIVTVGEFLGAAFAIILLLGIEAQSRSDARELRLANTRLEELRTVEVERAALATRAQVAREVHDGLAQELWFAKLKAGRLAAQADLAPESRELADEVASAVDRALADARAALIAIRAGLDGEPDLAAALAAYVDEFGARAGIQADFEAESALPAVPSQAAGEILRILVEALLNVQKHAAARRVRVTARNDAGTLEMAVVDDGRGFDPVAAEGSRFGIRGMRERAERLGGRVDISSSRRGGTRLIVRVPALGPGA